jgi:23S rRNA (uracil1939-C5)-methyltransferase
VLCSLWECVDHALDLRHRIGYERGVAVSQNTIDLTIQRLGPKGDGVYLDSGSGRPVFVEGAVPGDRIKGRLKRDETGVLRAEVIEILEPSSLRQEAPCPHYERCGNCTLQHLSENFYRRWKIDLVKEAFQKHGLKPLRWLDPVFLAGRNRRRVTFAVYKRRGKIVMGYYRRRSKEITEIESCLVADPRLLELADVLKPFLAAILLEVKPVDLFIQIADEAADLLITGPVGSHVPDVAAKVLRFTRVKRISWRARERDLARVIVSNGPVTASFGSIKVSLPADSFLQPTVDGERVLVNSVKAALPMKGKFADLFAGCGTFSGPLLSRGSVDAYESSQPMVGALAKAGREERLRVFRRDLFRHPLRRDELNRYDGVVFDPPRMGCPEQAFEMASAKVGTLVVVSCNPATFARDASFICEGGYRLQSLQLVDQFLWSHHAEVIGVFTKGNRRP